MVAPYEAVSGIELIEGAKAKGIRFVQLQFTDIMGAVKAVTIPIHQLEGSVRHGVTSHEYGSYGTAYSLARI